MRLDDTGGRDLMGTRTLYLIRHGQMDPNFNRDDPREGGLSKLGRKQAALTARKLGSIPVSMIYHSTLRRAAETAQIISHSFPGVRCVGSKALWECIPSIPPGVETCFVGLQEDQMLRDKERAARLFARHFVPTRGSDRSEVVVCHGNLIRYF